MQQEPILRTQYLRHGHTKYTGAGLDLTVEGIAQAIRAANVDVAYWMRHNKIAPRSLLIMSSPAARAYGTADTIVKTLRLPGEIIIDPDLSPMTWRDPERCKAALGGLAGRGYIDYETEPIFGDPSLFETQEEMRKRAFKRFARRIREARDTGRPQYELSFSHYEVFCHYVAALFDIVASESTALRYAEPIELTVFDVSTDSCLVLSEFRKQTSWLTFNIAEETFVPD